MITGIFNEYRLERYEMKYVIPFDMVGPISDFISPYCNLDKYSICTAGNFYTIQSLYVDTPSKLFLNQRLDKCNEKTSMRIRSYNEKGGPPWFFEVKMKKGNIVNKIRIKQTGMGHTAKKNVLLSYLPEYEIGESNNEKPSLFQSLYLHYGVEPQLILKYRRKAFMSEIDDYARVTFDTGLCCVPQNKWSFTDENPLDYYDYSDDSTRDRIVVMELKCYCTQVPFWMVDLVRRFDLTRQRFSKYVHAQLHIKKCEERTDCCDRINSSGVI